MARAKHSLTVFRLPAIVLLAFVCAQCHSVDVQLIAPPDGGEPMIPGLRALRVDPPSVELAEDGNAPFATTTLRAMGTFDDEEIDITDQVAWSLSNPAIGAIESGVFTGSGVGGEAFAEARSGAIAAGAQIEVRLVSATLRPGTPADSVTRFEVDPQLDREDEATLALLYPNNETRLPPNLAGLRIDWNTSGPDLFEVAFVSDATELHYYSVEPFLDLTREEYRTLAESHPNRIVRVRVRGTSEATVGVVYRTAEHQLEFFASELNSIAIYEEGSSQELKIAKWSDTAATRYHAQGTEGIEKHVVSRDGRRVAFGEDGKLIVIDTETKARLIDKKILEREDGGFEEEDAKYEWASFGPGADLIIVAAEGEFRVVEVDSREELEKEEYEGMQHATQPDWSPDGRHVVFALVTGPRPDDDDFSGASLARVTVSGSGDIGDPEIIIQSSSTSETFSHPAYSPDGRFIAYVRSQGSARDNPTSELYIANADGSNPRPLTKVNRRFGSADSGASLAATEPVWVSTESSQTYWITFSSSRDYGTIITQETFPEKHIWVAGIRADEDTSDPSYAAFLLPFQGLGARNRRPFFIPCTLTALCD